MSERRSESSEAMVQFLKERVESNQGIPLQQLTGHLSQLPSDLRAKYGCSVNSLKVFLRQFPNVFVIRNNGKVYVRTKSRRATSSLNSSLGSFMTSMSHRRSHEDDVTCLTDVKGSVYRIFRLYGFISVEYPIKTSVFFDVKAFENGEHTSLPSCGLHVGDCVILDAKVGPKDCKAKFRAIRVARTSMPEPSSSPCLLLHSVSDGGEGDSNTSTHLVNQHGVIEKVKSKYGFIKFGRDLRERAFFYVKNVDKSLGKSIKYLPNVFTVEDKVRFNARPSKKPSDKVKWEATAVYLYGSSDRNGASDSEGASGNEIFMSDDECDIEDLEPKLEYERRRSCLNESPVRYADWDASSVIADSWNSSFKGNRSARRRLSEWERRQKLSGERGCFYPVTESVGVVKFGPGRGFSARAAVEVTFRQNSDRIHNLLWEVADGQEVVFDAVQEEDNAWIATLVCIGPRPAEPIVGDCEDVCNRITNKDRDAHRPDAEPGTSGDFGGEETVPNRDPRSQPNQTSISIYKDAKGVIVRIAERIGTCEIHELAASRRIEFKSECFYKDGNVFMGDLNEVLREGDPVLLDYMVGVKGTREEMRCDLVWQGRRPRDVRQMSPEEFLQRLQISTHDSENSLGFEDFEKEIARADDPSRVPSCAQSDTGLTDDTFPSMGCGASSPISVVGFLATRPLATSTPVGVRSPRAHNESSACESAPEISFLSAGVNDEALHRLAKMLAAEIIAEEQNVHVAFHDVGVQTVDKEHWSSPSSKHECLVLPALVNSSTQTLSTGGIKSENLFIE